MTRWFAVLVVLGAVPPDAAAQAAAATDSATHLGTVHFPVSCAPASRAAFERAVALLHHMTYPQAAAAFTELRRRDPGCAMASWGIAMTLFQPLWPTRPGPAELRQGWDAVEQARTTGAPTDRERLLIAAAAEFFRDPDGADYWLRIRRWAGGMEQAHAAYPNDDEVTAFYALSLLSLAPSDSVTRTFADRAAALLLPVYQRNHDHPGAMHYLVHANDMPGREREQLGVTRRYDSVAPANPHALHMPTHIYTRLGDWEGVIRGNRLAARAALAHPAGPRGEFVWDEYPHAVEYLVYAALQQADHSGAAAEVRRLVATPALQPSFKTAFHLASTRARLALERRAWAEAAALIPRDPPGLPWDRFTWPEAITHFARGLGAIRLERMADASSSLADIVRLEAATRAAGEMLFARNIEVLRLELAAWVADGSGDAEGAIGAMRDAVALEAATPKHAVTPGPTLPAAEQLGDLLTKQGRPAEALTAYRRALADYPNRLNALLGAVRAAKAVGDTAALRAYARQVLEQIRNPELAAEVTKLAGGSR